MSKNVKKNLELWLQARLSDDNWQWLQSRLTLLRESNATRDLHISLGLVPRKLGRADLNLSEAEIDAASRASNHVLDTREWTVETTARILMLTTVADQDEKAFALLFKDLCRTADLNESITFYRGIALTRTAPNWMRRLVKACVPIYEQCSRLSLTTILIHVTISIKTDGIIWF